MPAVPHAKPVKRRRRSAATSEDAEPGRFSSPACYLHEFEPAGTAAPGVQVKRIHDERCADDGRRVLVDRLWPRGISKERAALDEWLPELAPSSALRKWYAHDPARWPEFRRRYGAELRANAQLLRLLRARAAVQRVTLLYAARDRRCNHAIVLRDALRRPPGAPRRPHKS
ncbi:MAG: hypothetical protein PVSMB6_15420 [Steroidobacteraceae bacterium]